MGDDPLLVSNSDFTNRADLISIPDAEDNSSEDISDNISQLSVTEESIVNEPIVVPIAVPSASQQRPHRQRQIPAKLLDYTGLPSHLINGISVDSNDSTNLLEPQTYKQASQLPEWCEAMHVELAALKANST